MAIGDEEKCDHCGLDKWAGMTFVLCDGCYAKLCHGAENIAPTRRKDFEESARSLILETSNLFPLLELFSAYFMVNKSVSISENGSKSFREDLRSIKALLIQLDAEPGPVFKE